MQDLVAYYSEGRRQNRPYRVVTIFDRSGAIQKRVAEHVVSTKREAKTVAAQFRATPWNF